MKFLVSCNVFVAIYSRSLFYDILCPQELENCKTCVHDDYQKCIDEMNYPGTGSTVWGIDTFSGAATLSNCFTSLLKRDLL